MCSKSKQRLLLLCLIAVVITFTAMQLTQGRFRKPWASLYHATNLATHADRHSSTTSKKFLYLLQTESCLPDDLKEFRALGDGKDRDVLVLSYRTRCTSNRLSNVDYLYNNSTTWATGRNMLYEASKLKESYLYYIFMDDDVILDLIDDDTQNSNPWRKFEEFLLQIEPAVGIADSSENPRVPIAKTSRKKLNCAFPDGTKPEYITSPQWDACFNAFHRKAIHHLLPYLPKFDHTSWWFSQRYIHAKCEVIFPGQALIHTNIRTNNPKHRKYPRKVATQYEEELIYNEVKASIPQKYRNCSILNEMIRNGLKHAFISSTFCLPLPQPKDTIEPFRLTAL